ncbi:uncharacterized protein LOC143210634 [Lasioglossum baleicum]|uniref:uncharacterized protein LOC143210634 n=1 Tax=Lasioglossum baleicum TaxID=434251 RepID=UPI003FCCD814
MKLCMLLLFVLQAYCGVLAVLEAKENGTEVDEQRSARVHRVASNDFLDNEDDIYAKDFMDPGTTEQSLLPGSRKREKLLERTDSTQSETEMFKYLRNILKGLSRDIVARNVDIPLNEQAEATESPASIKGNAIFSRNLLNLPEEMDIFFSDDRDTQKSTHKPGHDYIAKWSDSESKMMNIDRYLDRLLTEIQNHVACIRNVLERLCWKHRSKSPPQLEVDNSRHPPTKQ